MPRSFPKFKDIIIRTPIQVQSPIRFGFEDHATRNVVIGIREKEIVQNAIFIGKIVEFTSGKNYLNYNVWLDVDYPYIIFICGKRGTGKSYDLGVIVEGLASVSGESRISSNRNPSAILIVDTLGQFWTMRQAPTKETDQEQVRLLHDWGLEPIAIANVVTYVPRGSRKFFSDWLEFSIKPSELEVDDWCGLLEVDKYLSRIGQLMHQVYEKVRKKGYVSVRRDPDSGEILSKRNIAPKSDYSIEDLIDCIESDEVITSRISGFEVQTRRALLSRLSDMSTWRIFAGEGVDTSEFFKKGKVTVLNLQDVDYGLKALITGVIVKKIFEGRAESRAKERAAVALRREAKSEIKEAELLEMEASKGIPAGWILIDEAHNYCPETGVTAAKHVLIKYAKEGRSLGLGLIATTQQPSALSAQLSSQVDILISHNLAFLNDIGAVEARLLNDPPGSVVVDYEQVQSGVLRRILRSLEIGDAIVSADGVNRVFCMRIRPRISVHGGEAGKFG